MALSENHRSENRRSENPVVVTGMGIASALGWTLDETWDAIRLGRSGLGRLTLFESERCGHLPAGQVPGDPSTRSGLRTGSRSEHLAAWAARQAFDDAGLRTARISPGRLGLVLGALTGGMEYIRSCIERLVQDGVAERSNLEAVECRFAVDRVARELCIDGFRTTVSNACASGGAALSVACDLLLAGESDVVLCGGVDSMNAVLVNGFSCLRLISPDGCRPFDAERRGMSVGEGAGVIVLERASHARARGARARAVLAGCGNSCDAYHATAPHPEGDGLVRAMREAMRDAGIGPEQVDYVNAHGTGTRDNDAAEARAIHRVFGARRPAVSSTKRFFGHAMAAAGAIEAITCVLALEHQALPANLGLRLADPELPGTGEPPLEPVLEYRAARIDVAVSNSLGFGGNNCAVVLRRAGSDS